MKKILLFGAGRSATHLIDYILEKGETYGWAITVVDTNVEQAREKIGTSPIAKAIGVDIFDETKRREFITAHELVISLLPASLHFIVAEDCFDIGRHLCTASYVTEEMEELARKARDKGLIFMGELGLDPGLDHMSAMECIDDLRMGGAELLSFKSFTGGLVAPESDTNPWHYKISWNPRNVVLAGKGTATYLLNDRLKYQPYHQLFKGYELVDIQGLGSYEMYANRDSISYRSIYGIENIPTILRGTLRHQGYCEAWDALIQLGMTDDSIKIEHCDQLMYKEFLSAFVPGESKPLRKRLAEHLGLSENSEVLMRLDFLGLFSDEKIKLEHASPARILEEIIKDKWKLEPTDRDMIIMQHEFTYRKESSEHQLISTLVMEGEDAVRTAMSKLVGLPLAIFVRLVMTGEIKGVKTTRPVTSDIYRPIISELQQYGVHFKHSPSGVTA